MPNMTYLGKGLCRGNSFQAILGQVSHLGNWLPCTPPGCTRSGWPCSRSWRRWGRRAGSWRQTRWSWCAPPEPWWGCCWTGEPSKWPRSWFPSLYFLLSWMFDQLFSESHGHPAPLLPQLVPQHLGLLLILLARGGILNRLPWTLTLISLSCIVCNTGCPVKQRSRSSTCISSGCVRRSVGIRVTLAKHAPGRHKQRSK